jgi:hypothetical protein
MIQLAACVDPTCAPPCTCVLVSAGGDLTCTLTITNTGNATLNNWAFNPAVSGCTPDLLVAGASHNCTVTEQVAEAEYAAWNASSPLAVTVDVEADAVQSEATPANVSRTASASLPFVPAPSTSPAASPESPSTCGACNTCVASVRTFPELTMANSDAAAIATAWSMFCTSKLQLTPTSCEFVKGRILASKDGNVGKRAGMICQLLQDCAAVPSDCRLQHLVAGSTPAALDLCTVGGTVAGDQVPGVQSTVTFTPAAGLCLDASHCGSVPGLVCNKQITTDQNTCSAGVDGVVTVGTCERTPCQTCKVGNCSAPNSNIC